MNKIVAPLQIQFFVRAQLIFFRKVELLTLIKDWNSWKVAQMALYATNTLYLLQIYPNIGTQVAQWVQGDFVWIESFSEPTTCCVGAV